MAARKGKTKFTHQILHFMAYHHLFLCFMYTNFLQYFAFLQCQTNCIFFFF